MIWSCLSPPWRSSGNSRFPFLVSQPSNQTINSREGDFDTTPYPPLRGCERSLGLFRWRKVKPATRSWALSERGPCFWCCTDCWNQRTFVCCIFVLLNKGLFLGLGRKRVNFSCTGISFHILAQVGQGDPAGAPSWQAEALQSGVCFGMFGKCCGSEVVALPFAPRMWLMHSLAAWMLVQDALHLGWIQKNDGPFQGSPARFDCFCRFVKDQRPCTGYNACDMFCAFVRLFAAFCVTDVLQVEPNYTRLQAGGGSPRGCWGRSWNCTGCTWTGRTSSRLWTCWALSHFPTSMDVDWGLLHFP